MSFSHPSLARLSEHQAKVNGETIAITYAGHDLSFAEVHQRVLRRAASLTAAGIRQGDRVAYLGANHPALVETLLACLRLGAIFIPLNWRLTASELAIQFEVAEVGLVIADPAKESTIAGLDSSTTIETMAWDPAPVVPTTGAGEIPAAALNGSDPAFLLFTSGTTGRPKGAVLSHANVLWNSFNLLLDTDIVPTDVTLVAAPLFHVVGLNQQVMTSYIRGCRILLEPRWDIDVVFDSIERHGLTWLSAVPTMFADLMQSPRWADTDLSALRFVNCGGAPVPLALINEYQNRGIAFCQGYGMTETAPGATFLPASDATQKPGSAGRAVPFTEVAIVDPTGNPCHAGVTGEIVVRGPNVMPGYWQNPEATAASFSPGGWFHTGDLGYLDEDGYLYIVDRLKDMFISGGENVYPAEVESALFAHAAVREVAVIAAPDERWGEVGRAFVVPAEGATPTADELRTFLTERVAKYKMPKYFELVDSLPRTGSGKVHKVTLRALPESADDQSPTTPNKDTP